MYVFFLSSRCPSKMLFCVNAVGRMCRTPCGRIRIHVIYIRICICAMMVWLSTEPDQINWPNIIYRRSKKQVIISFVSHSAIVLMPFHFWKIFSSPCASVWVRECVCVRCGWKKAIAEDKELPFHRDAIRVVPFYLYMIDSLLVAGRRRGDGVFI